MIRKHIETPAKYEAIAPEEAVKMLLLRKEEANKEIRGKASEFLLMYHDERGIEGENEDKMVVVARDNKSGVDAELIRLIRKTKWSLDFTTRQQLFSVAFNEPGLEEWIDEMYSAARRGVKFRMVLDKPENVKPFSLMTFSVANSKHLLTHPNFQFRYVSEAPECIIILFDNQASCIETSCQHKTKMSPYMITNNQVFANLNKAYFELLWSQGNALVRQSFGKVRQVNFKKSKKKGIIQEISSL